jgi:hypothetical protein
VTLLSLPTSHNDEASRGEEEANQFGFVAPCDASSRQSLPRISSQQSQYPNIGMRSSDQPLRVRRLHSIWLSMLKAACSREALRSFFPPLLSPSLPRNGLPSSLRFQPQFLLQMHSFNHHSMCPPSKNALVLPIPLAMQHEYACLRIAIPPFTLRTLLNACEHPYIRYPLLRTIPRSPLTSCGNELGNGPRHGFETCP